MAVVFERPKSLLDVPTHYCPGCTHGIVHRILCEVIDEMGIEGDTIGVCPVGCSVMAYDYFGCDMIEAAHGQSAGCCYGCKAHKSRISMYLHIRETATLLRSVLPRLFTPQQEAKILSLIFINNTIYGMTGGQMAPTTLPGQVTQTTPFGRSPELAGYPVKVCEMLSTLTGTAYAERVAVDSVPHIRAAKKAIRKAFENQKAKKGFSIVEVLSTCPTNWGTDSRGSYQATSDRHDPVLSARRLQGR